MRIVLNFGIKKRQLSFPTRLDQCKAGPGDVKRTAAQHKKRRGLVMTRSTALSATSTLRFHVGSRYSASAGTGAIRGLTMGLLRISDS